MPDRTVVAPSDWGELVTSMRQPRGKSELLHVLRRAGYPQETIDALDGALPEVYEPARYEQLLARYGVTLAELSERMASSP